MKREHKPSKSTRRVTKDFNRTVGEMARLEAALSTAEILNAKLDGLILKTDRAVQVLWQLENRIARLPQADMNDVFRALNAIIGRLNMRDSIDRQFRETRGMKRCANKLNAARKNLRTSARRQRRPGS